MNRLVLLVLKLLKKNISIEDVLELFVELAKVTPIEVDDKIANKLLELYKSDPELFIKVISMIISVILSEEPIQKSSLQEKVKEIVNENKKASKKEKEVKPEEDKTKEDKNEEDGENEEKIKQEVDDILKGLFQ